LNGSEEQSSHSYEHDPVANENHINEDYYYDEEENHENN